MWERHLSQNVTDTVFSPVLQKIASDTTSAGRKTAPEIWICLTLPDVIRCLDADGMLLSILVDLLGFAVVLAQVPLLSRDTQLHVTHAHDHSAETWNRKNCQSVDDFSRTKRHSRRLKWDRKFFYFASSFAS